MKERQTTPDQTLEGKTAFQLAIEESVGETTETICEMPPEERRRLIETKYRSPMKFTSNWPFIGRSDSP